MLGSNCDNPTYYAFGVTSWGRLVFCGSPRRYEPRWFRSPEMHGVKNENSPCPAFDGEMAQAPDGLILTCVANNGASLWLRGDTLEIRPPSLYQRVFLFISTHLSGTPGVRISL